MYNYIGYTVEYIVYILHKLCGKCHANVVRPGKVKQVR